MEKLKHIIAIDRINISSGKNKIFLFIIVMLFFLVFAGFAYSPAAVFIEGILVAPMIPELVFQNEMKNHSEKLWGILPVSRKELVNARFFYMIIAYFCIYIVLFVLMRISLALQLYDRWQNEPEIMEMIAQRTDGAISVKQIFYICAITGFAVGLTTVSSQLRAFFKHDKLALSLRSDEFFKSTKSMKLTDKIIPSIIVIVVFLFMFFMLGVIPLNAATSIFAQLIIQLIISAHGIPFCAVILTFSLLRLWYFYTCATLEYDDLEL